MKRILTKPARLGRLSVPMWALAIGLLAVLGAAGQAVGPVLVGAVGGSATLTVEQTVLLSTISDSSDANDYATAIDDDGTGFNIAIETQAGQKIDDINFTLANDSGEPANAVLRLDWPAELDVEVEERSPSSISVARISQNHWLMNVPGPTADNLGTLWAARVDGGAGDTNDSQVGGEFQLSRVPGSGVRGRGSGERETTASSLAGKHEAREKEDNGGQGKDGPAGAVAQGGNGR